MSVRTLGQVRLYWVIGIGSLMLSPQWWLGIGKYAMFPSYFKFSFINIKRGIYAQEALSRKAPGL